jgi:hypothetical protein
MRISRWAALALAASVATPAPASAHFLWLKAEPSGSPPAARVYFGEAPEPGEPDLVARIAGTEAWADGEPLDVKAAEDGLEAALPGARPAAIDAACDYGVVTRRGPAFLLRYAARAQAAPVDAGSAEVPAAEYPRLVWAEESGEESVVQAVWRGRPVAGAAVKIYADEGEPREVLADADGRLVVEGLRRSSLLLKVVEEEPGRRDGLDYGEVRYYATLTVGGEPAGRPSGDEPASADERLERAHRARAAWGPGFPGFTADLVVDVDGESVRGTVDVAPDGGVELDLPDGPARDWARAQLRSIVMHRGLDGPVELDPGATFLEPEESHPLGRLIQLADDRMGSAYRIRGDEILEVSRASRGARFTNRILANARNAEGKLLPLAYTVSHWDDASGKLDRVEVFHATWTRVGRLDLPKTHTQVVTSDAMSSVRRLELSGHRLKGDPPASDGAK